MATNIAAFVAEGSGGGDLELAVGSVSIVTDDYESSFDLVFLAGYDYDDSAKCWDQRGTELDSCDDIADGASLDIEWSGYTQR